MSELRTIIHRYSDDELNAVNARFTEVAQDLETVENEAKITSDGFKKQVKSLKSVQKEMLENIRSKSEMRDVEVEPRPNYATNMMEYYSVDGGEMVDQRRLMPNERQLTIDNDATVVSMRHKTA
jgi:3-phosphoglycerate kinase